ncbi:hypothetical protein BC827DRAFT_1271997 [Russula dissimulans]|nr:hypothetical protein BC827DRAFT_1271997 [Russula dissimulans]
MGALNDYADCKSEALCIAPETKDEPEVDEEEAEGEGEAQESDLDELSSPSLSLPPAQTIPSRSSRLKITLKLPTQTENLPRAIHKDKDLDSDIELEDDDDDDDDPRDGDGKRLLTTRQAALASVVRSSHVSLGEGDQPPPEDKMFLFFSVPASLLLVPHQPAIATSMQK